jgi:L-threonylcarbamoyladenylate synthase
MTMPLDASSVPLGPSAPGAPCVLSISPQAIRQAAEVLARGGLVAFPTETVYGLGGDATQPAAVQAIFAAKGRPADHPLIVHLASADWLSQYAAHVPQAAWALAEAFWPGPLTLVLRRSPSLSPLVSGGLDTVGLRVPAHPAARALLEALARPIAAPSANRFGRVSPTTAQHVAEDLGARVDLILDGGPCGVGIESTIVDLSGPTPAILRPGGITQEQIAAVVGALGRPDASGRPRVSGSLPSHYAPRARVEIVRDEALLSRAQELARQGANVAILWRREENPPLAAANIHIISIPADDAACARVLYAALRQIDALGCDVALASLPQEIGLGAAIADRLRRAAGPRAPTEARTPADG